MSFWKILELEHHDPGGTIRALYLLVIMTGAGMVMSPAPVQSDKTGVFAWDSRKEMFFSEHRALWVYTLYLADLQYSAFVNETLHQSWLFSDLQEVSCLVASFRS